MEYGHVVPVVHVSVRLAATLFLCHAALVVFGSRTTNLRVDVAIELSLLLVPLARALSIITMLSFGIICLRVAVSESSLRRGPSDSLREDLP